MARGIVALLRSALRAGTADHSDVSEPQLHQAGSLTRLSVLSVWEMFNKYLWNKGNNLCALGFHVSERGGQSCHLTTCLQLQVR